MVHRTLAPVPTKYTLSGGEKQYPAPRRWGALGYPWGSRGFPSYVPATARSAPAVACSRPRTRLTASPGHGVPRHAAYSRTGGPGRTSPPLHRLLLALRSYALPPPVCVDGIQPSHHSLKFLVRDTGLRGLRACGTVMCLLVLHSRYFLIFLYVNS